MFTGLIEAMSRVAGLQPRGAMVRLAIDRPSPSAAGWGPEISVGESISVQGVCLTVAAPPSEIVEFDVVAETLAKTTLGGLAAGDRVNVERSATLATLLGGHLVQGHVDGVGVFERVVTQPEWRVCVRPPSELMAYLAPKGSVCLDGVSLTVADVRPADGVFDVALIPTTLAKTTLGGSGQGHRCNIECDAIAKTVVQYLRHYAPK